MRLVVSIRLEANRNVRLLRPWPSGLPAFERAESAERGHPAPWKPPDPAIWDSGPLETGPWWNTRAECWRRLPHWPEPNGPAGTGRTEADSIPEAQAFRWWSLRMVKDPTTVGRNGPNEPAAVVQDPVPGPEFSWRRTPPVERRPKIRPDTSADPLRKRQDCRQCWSCHWPRIGADGADYRTIRWPLPPESVLLRGEVDASGGRSVPGRRLFPVWSSFHLRPPELRSSTPSARPGTG